MSSIDLPVSHLQPLRRSRVYWTIADALVLAKRQLKQIPRIPEELVFSTIQPIMFVLLFRYVFGGAIAVTGTTYVNYLMAGIFVQTIAFGSTSTGIGIAQDLQRGLVDRFRSLPMSRSAVLMGRTIADLVRNSFVVLVMIVVGLLVGFRPAGSVLGWIAGGGLLLLGLFTRPIAFILSGEMAFAYFMVHYKMNHVWPILNHGDEAVLFCFVFLYLSAAGGGPVSLDRAIRRV